jgi:gamma-glutamylcyclotransferase (GGCT)/AIG2-like uncharacterized protein YtfP
MTSLNRLLAVCCELREDLINHKILKDCKKVGEFLSAPEFTLINVEHDNTKVGLKKGSNSVVFEVYEINVTILDKVSTLKGFYQHNYNINIHDKAVIDTPFGVAYVYLEKNTKITSDNIIKEYDYTDYLTYNINK